MMLLGGNYYNERIQRKGLRTISKSKSDASYVHVDICDVVVMHPIMIFALIY